MKKKLSKTEARLCFEMRDELTRMRGEFLKFLELHALLHPKKKKKKK